jgi:hypothetical protein
LRSWCCVGATRDRLLLLLLLLLLASAVVS